MYKLILILLFVFGTIGTVSARVEPVCTTKSDFPASVSWDNTIDTLFHRKGGLLPNQTASVEFATGNSTESVGAFDLVNSDGIFARVVSTCPGNFIQPVGKYCVSGTGKIRITTGPARDGFCKLEPNSRYYFNIRNESPEGFYFTFQFMHTDG